jgi:hypothetical protein
LKVGCSEFFSISRPFLADFYARRVWLALLVGVIDLDATICVWFLSLLSMGLVNLALIRCFENFANAAIRLQSLELARQLSTNIRQIPTRRRGVGFLKCIQHVLSNP